MYRKISEKIFESISYLIGKLIGAVNAIALALLISFVEFSISIEVYWTYFYFWFGIAYISFFCVWLDWMQKLISEPLNKNTNQ